MEIKYSNILQFSHDLYSDEIIPYFNSNTFITFAGVCVEWRRIAKQYKGFKYVNVKHKLSIFEVESLKDDEMTGLSKGDLSELFSEIEIITFPIPVTGLDDTYHIYSRALFKKLFNSRKIESLTLCNTNLITIVIPAKNISPITSLKLFRVQMKIDNLRTICTSLQNLTDLTLVDNELDYKATVVITNSKLNRLENLTICNPIGNEGVNQIITRPGNIRTLKKLELLSNNRYSYSRSPSNFSYLPPIDSSILPNLESFSIDIELQDSTQSIMNIIRSGNCWKELTFKNSNLDDRCMKQIGNIHSLQKICLLQPTMVEHLVSYSYLLPLQNNLTQLEIGPVDNKALPDLSEGKFLNLKYLCIQSNTESEIDEFVMEKLCEKIPNVTHLELRKLEMKSGYIMNHISQLVKLTDLRLLEINIDSEGMKYLSSGMSNLTRLDLGSGTLDGISYLCNGNLLNLTTLNFTRAFPNKIYDLAFATCFADCSNIPKLRYLSFYHNFDYKAMNKLISGEGNSLKNLIHLEFIWVDLMVSHLECIATNLAPKFLSGSGDNYHLINSSPEVIPKLKPSQVNFTHIFSPRRIGEFIDEF